MKVRVISFFAAIIICLLSLCSCGEEKYDPKKFTVGDLTIELTDGFKREFSENYDAVYTSRKIGVYIKREKFTDLKSEEKPASELKPSDYAQGIIDGSKLNTTVKTSMGRTTFTYEVHVDSEWYTFYALVYKSSDSFWLVQFATKSDSFESQFEAINDFAWSVEFAS